MARNSEKLPPGLVPRGLTRDQAAAFFGLSGSSYDKGRAAGKLPEPTLPGGRYDHVLLELAANQLSGILSEAGVSNPYDEWKATHS